MPFFHDEWGRERLHCPIEPRRGVFSRLGKRVKMRWCNPSFFLLTVQLICYTIYQYQVLRYTVLQYTEEGISWKNLTEMLKGVLEGCVLEIISRKRDLRV